MGGRVCHVRHKFEFRPGRFKFRRKPLTAIHLYNYTQSISTFDSVNVMYSPRTSRDGAFEGEDSE